MSQQINLLLPELRPQRDWLAFPAVAAASLAVIVGIAGMAVWVGNRLPIWPSSRLGARRNSPNCASASRPWARRSRRVIPIPPCRRKSRGCPKG